MASDATTVATPTADTSTATGGDPMDTLFDDGIPTTDFPIDVVNQLGETTSKAKTDDAVAITDGAVAQPAKPKAEEPVVEAKPADLVEEEEVGEPYTIGKDGRVRGPDGRFTDKPKATEAADSKVASDVSDAKPVPFKYRTMGETKEFAGATLDGKGNLTIPAEKVGDVRAALNALHVRDAEIIPTIQKTQAENARLVSENKRLTEGQTAKEAQAQAVLSRFDAVMKEPDDEKFVEEMFKLRASLPQITVQAERDYWKRQAEQGKPGPDGAKPAAAASPAAPASPTTGLPSQEEAVGAVKDVVSTLKIEHDYRDIGDKDWQQFEAQAEETPLAYVRRATDADAKAYGVTVGEAVFDNDLLMKHVGRYVSQLREQRAAALKREKLAADNSRRTTPVVATPPAVTSAKPPTPKKSEAFTSKDEVERWLESNEL